MTPHLVEYLDFYKKLKAPGYAVLIKGDWGSGKTHQIRSYFKEEEIYYVSLFGIQSVEDVYAAVLAEIDPGLTHAKKLFGGLEKKAAASGHWIGALGSTVAGAVAAALRKDAEVDRTLVFDDLERSCLDAKAILGVINYYVEHKSARVIVIAHDEKLTEQFGEINEKIFGQSLQIEPMIESSFDSFIKKHKKESGQFILKHKLIIISIFKQSNVKSLRIFRHVIEDISRLHDVLMQRHIENELAMQELVMLLCAFNLEIRNRTISASDLKDRRGRKIRHFMNTRSTSSISLPAPEKPRFITANDRYSEVELESTLLSDEALSDMLINGRYHPDTICACLDSSHFFVKPGDTPPWKIVLGFDNLSDDIVEPALKTMNEQFLNREFDDPGVMLHIFALKMMMSFNEISTDSIESVKDQCIAYIDDLLIKGNLPASPPEWRLEDGFSESHDGLGYWVHEEYRDAFQEVRSHLVKSMDRALQSKFPDFAAELLQFMVTDSMKFLQLVGRTGAGSGKYEHAPVLAAITPEKFVETWMSSPRKNWKAIRAGLEARYENDRITTELPEERHWFIKIIDLLDAESKKEDGLRSLRIKRLIDPKLTQIRDALISAPTITTTTTA